MAFTIAYKNAATNGPAPYMACVSGDGFTVATALVPAIAVVDGSGNQITGFGAPATGTPTQTGVTVTTGNTALIVANASRRYLMIQNQDSTNPIWVSMGGTAAANDTCTKIIAGAALVFENGYIPTCALSAIATGANVSTLVMTG